MQSIHPAAGGPRVVLNVTKLNELRRAHGIESEAEMARVVGVDPATLYRIQRGEVAPSNAFIARLALAFPSVSLDALFTIVRTPKQQAAVASR